MIHGNGDTQYGKRKESGFAQRGFQLYRFTEKVVGMLLVVEWPRQVSIVEVEIVGRIPGWRPIVVLMLLTSPIRVRVPPSRNRKARCPIYCAELYAL